MEKRILIVDDDERICALIARRLTIEGYWCVTANNGREALQHFYKDKFSVIISDIKMPELNGIELLKNVKAMDQNMVVVMMTAYPEVDVAVEAIRQGAYDFIIKPFDLDLVVFSVKKAFEKRSLEEKINNYHQHLEKLIGEKTAKLQHAYRVLKKDHLDTVKVLIEAIDAKDPYARGHSDRVREMSLRIARKLGFGEDRMEGLEYGALLHDIGKLGIKDEVLQKQGPLTPEQYQHIQEHPLIGVKIVEEIDFFKDQVPMIRHHHEHFDGSGYPDGLAGEEIPIEARIIAVSDAFDAMTSARPHRTKMTFESTLAEMRKHKGKQFDPDILEVFMSEKLYDSPPKCIPITRAELSSTAMLM
jgi:putative nucleotidyltransferase with HDIG domain